MSMGKWAEDAQIDETAAIRAALKEARRAKVLAKLADKGMSDLVEKSESVTPPPAHRPIGGSKKLAGQYPHRDESANRNYRVRDLSELSWEERMSVKHRIRRPNSLHYREYSPQARYKVQDIGNVDNPDIVGKGDETHYAHTLVEDVHYVSPEWLIETFMGKKDIHGQDALKTAYNLLYS